VTKRTSAAVWEDLIEVVTGVKGNVIIAASFSGGVVS